MARKTLTDLARSLGGKRGRVQFAGTARSVLRTNWTCPSFSFLVQNSFRIGERIRSACVYKVVEHRAESVEKTDIQLAADACRGDANAFGILVERYRGVDRLRGGTLGHARMPKNWPRKRFCGPGGRPPS